MDETFSAWTCCFCFSVGRGNMFDLVLPGAFERSPRRHKCSHAFESRRGGNGWDRNKDGGGDGDRQREVGFLIKSKSNFWRYWDNTIFICCNVKIWGYKTVVILRSWMNIGFEVTEKTEGAELKRTETRIDLEIKKTRKHDDDDNTVIRITIEKQQQWKWRSVELKILA